MVHTYRHIGTRGEPYQAPERKQKLRVSSISMQVVVTRGIAALGEQRVERIVQNVTSYADFSPGNDPYTGRAASVAAMKRRASFS